MRYLDAIFIQPSYGCALDCKGCYVKESVQNGQMPRELIKEFLEYLFTGYRIQTRQITIAVDNLPEGNGDQSTRDRHIMLGTLKTAVDLKKETKSDTELHVTANSYAALYKYWRQIGPFYIDNERSPVNLISYSHIPKSVLFKMRDYFATKSHTQINYNYTPDGNWAAYEEALKVVDMSYFVLHKAGLGHRNDPKQIQLYKEGLRFVDTLPEELKKKVVVDSCVTDSYDFLKTGHGCSANIRKIHIWPDGHVSGCPYNKEGGHPAHTLEQLISNIEEVMKQYEFRKCTIPKDYFGRKEPTSTSVGSKGQAAQLKVI